jgi:hypothetical protein
MSEGGIDIVIDEITDCLIERASGQNVETTVEQVSFNWRPRGWKFDWSIPEKQGSSVFALKVKGDSDDVVQGLIAFHEDEDNLCFFGDLLESNSQNIGKYGTFVGVGAHLTAFVCKLAKEAGYDAYYFKAKTQLINHYVKTLGARQIGSTPMMCILEPEFGQLINTYYKKAD